MKLEQLRLDFVPEQDRLLLRIATDDGKELALWLTRRCLRLLWALLIELAKSDPRIALQSSADARAALLGLEHEHALQGADFASPYREGARERPLGAEPLLVTRLAHARDSAGYTVLTLGGTGEQQIDLTLDAQLLHAICGLLQKVAGDTEWDLALALPQSVAPGPAPAGRTIN